MAQTTKHYQNDRSIRERIINEIIGQGKVIKSFKVNRHHKNGPEAHMITDTAIIVIYNYNTKRLVTKLIARPGQIKRYYDAIGQEAPKELMEKAYANQKLGYNKI